MKNFIYIYHSTINTPPSQEAFDAFADWFNSLGDKVVDGGNPISPLNKAVIKNGTVTKGDDTIIGYAIVKAANLDEAVAMAKNSPLANNEQSAIHVYETTQM